MTASVIWHQVIFLGMSKDRERDRDERDLKALAEEAAEQAAGPSRSFAIPWATKHSADDETMKALNTKDTKHMDNENQWRWHNIHAILAESYSCMDANLDGVFQGFKSTCWNLTGMCLICQAQHRDRWYLTNTPGFKHTTLVGCHKTGQKRLIPRLPF